MDGLANGFLLLPPDTCVLSASCSNYDSALQPDVKSFLDTLFASELAEGKISGQSHRPLRINAIGAVPKRDSTDFRPITDCSRPLHDSLNDYIRPTLPKFSLKSIDNAINAIVPGCYIALVDIKAAYRSVPVQPQHRQFLGFVWDLASHPFPYFVDNCLSFGLSCAPLIFCRISAAIVRGFKRFCHQNGLAFRDVIVYIDDFCIICNTLAECVAAQNALISLLIHLGFAISWSKLQAPTQTARFLGIWLDTVALEASLPPEKLTKLHSMVVSFSQRSRLSKRELQSLCGFLNFASKVVRGARTFTRRLIDSCNSLKLPHHSIRVSQPMKADFNWWIQFSLYFNGRAILISDSLRPPVYISCDASSYGFGAVFGSLWFAGNWQGSASPYYHKFLQCSGNWLDSVPVPACCRDNINYLELFAVFIAAQRWAPFFANRRILVLTDNTQAMYCLNTGRSRNSQCMNLLRQLFWLSVRYNFHLTSRHLPGDSNVLADALSRLDEPNYLNRFLSMHSDAVSLFPILQQPAPADTSL